MSHTKFLFVGNGEYQNRGCEAITLGTIEILRKAFGEDVSFVDVPYMDFDALPPSWVPKTPNYEYHPRISHKRFTKGWWIRNALRVMPSLRERYLLHQCSGGMLPYLAGTRVALALGGDNYSVDYGMPYGHLNSGKVVRKHNIPFYIWGGSVGPFDKRPDFGRIMLDHLQTEVTGVLTREKRSYNYLRQNRIENICMMSDPAFVMDPEPVTSEQLGFEIPADAIGINLSPIMRNYCHRGNMAAWRENARAIIMAVLNHFDRPVLLIPHVTIAINDNDYLFMKSCLQGIEDPRIHLVDGRLNARQTKWLISNLSCLVAARTHATIAAFSTKVPTVSLAYSVKAFGLNDMMFGHNDYLVPPGELHEKSVLSTVQRVFEDSESIKQHFQEIMPTVFEDAYRAGVWLRRQMEEKSLDSTKAAVSCFPEKEEVKGDPEKMVG